MTFAPGSAQLADMAASPSRSASSAPSKKKPLHTKWCLSSTAVSAPPWRGSRAGTTKSGRTRRCPSPKLHPWPMTWRLRRSCASDRHSSTCSCSSNRPRSADHDFGRDGWTDLDHVRLSQTGRLLRQRGARSDGAAHRHPGSRRSHPCWAGGRLWSQGRPCGARDAFATCGSRKSTRSGFDGDAARRGQARSRVSMLEGRELLP